MMFAATFEPAYHLIITAHPSQVKAAQNNHVNLCTQDYLESLFNVPASRGVIQFGAIPEGCLTINGQAVLHKKKVQKEHQTPLRRAISRYRIKHGSRALTVRATNDSQPVKRSDPAPLAEPVMTSANHQNTRETHSWRGFRALFRRP